jgi:hypothetical protein
LRFGNSLAVNLPKSSRRAPEQRSNSQKRAGQRIKGVVASNKEGKLKRISLSPLDFISQYLIIKVSYEEHK